MAQHVSTHEWDIYDNYPKKTCDRTTGELQKIAILILDHTSTHTKNMKMGWSPPKLDPQPYMQQATHKGGTIFSASTLEYVSIEISGRNYQCLMRLFIPSMLWSALAKHQEDVRLDDDMEPK